VAQLVDEDQRADQNDEVEKIHASLQLHSAR
jgi:hypothetical protein